eukprot:1776561-Prymnesium_polylepis.1
MLASPVSINRFRTPETVSSFSGCAAASSKKWVCKHMSLFNRHVHRAQEHHSSAWGWGPAGIWSGCETNRHAGRHGAPSGQAG